MQLRSILKIFFAGLICAYFKLSNSKRDPRKKTLRNSSKDHQNHSLFKLNYRSYEFESFHVSLVKF